MSYISVFYAITMVYLISPTLLKLRVSGRCLINVDLTLIRYRHDVVMKIDSASLSSNLTALFRC